MKLSVIVPVFNERRTIALILEKVRAVPIEKEIIVVDGGSFDGTREALREEEQRPPSGGNVTCVIYEPERRGRGRALKEGLAAATGEIVIFQDADLELDPSDYPALIAPLLAGEADVVFGSRFLQGRPHMTFLQYWGNKAVNAGVNLLYGTRLTDVETCYQVFRREAIAGMELDNNDFAFTVELTVKLVRRGFRIREIPIKYIPRGRMEGKKIYWGDGVWALWTLLKYRFISPEPRSIPVPLVRAPEAGVSANQTPGAASGVPGAHLISEFYGIRIYQPAPRGEPFVQAQFRDASWEVSLADPPQLLAGDAPKRAQQLVAEWIAEHRAALQENVQIITAGNAPHPVPPLD